MIDSSPWERESLGFRVSVLNSLKLSAATFELCSHRPVCFPGLHEVRYTIRDLFSKAPSGPPGQEGF